MPRSLSDKFFDKVDRREPDVCWPWLGTIQAGYGQMKFQGKGLRAHRVSWELHNGQEIPAGLYACHTCDNPGCVNPHHIFVGTPRDNMLDMVAKGRNRYVFPAIGERCSRGHSYAEQTPYPSDTQRRRCRKCHYGLTSAAAKLKRAQQVQA